MKINHIEMDSLAMEYKSLQSQIDALTARLEAVKENIKNAMGNEEDYRTETFHFVYKTVISNRFDSTAFKRDNPVIAAQYMRASESRPLKIN